MDIPHFVYPVHALMDTGCFHLLTFMNNVAINMGI